MAQNGIPRSQKVENGRVERTQNLERIADIDQLGRAGESIGGRSLPPVREPLQKMPLKSGAAALAACSAGLPSSFF
jgi:hypothetical protein